MSFKIGDVVRSSRGWRGEIEKIRADHSSVAVNREWTGDVVWVHPASLKPDAHVGNQPDPVQSPAHYDLPGGIQVIDLIRDESFLRGNLIKYVFRAPHKGNELEDLKKAAEYLKWEIERVEAK